MSVPHLGWFRVEESAVRKLRDTFDRQSAYRLALIVYVTLCRIANLDGSDTFTRRIASIASDAGLSYNAASEGLVLVRDAGLLKINAQTIGASKEKAPSEYQLLRMSPTEWATSPIEKGRLPKSQNFNLQRVSKNSTKNFDQEPPVPPKGAGVFDQFWIAYPKKVGKGAAEKAWKRIPKPVEMLPVILASIAKHRRSEQWRREGGQFIPHPATWLNQRRWEDEVQINYVALPAPKRVSDVMPPWKAQIVEIRSLLANPDANAFRLRELGEALPREAWNVLDGVTEQNPLRAIMKKGAS